MKIFEQKESPLLIRVNIKKSGEETKHITLCETTQNEVKKWVVSILENQKINPLYCGKRTTIEIRESVGAKNGKSISVPLKGLTVNEVYNILIKQL